MTAVRKPRYALLTGSAAAITCFFAASYDNADIGRYYLGPALMAWTWLAILAGAAVDVLTASTGEPVAEAAFDPAPDDEPGSSAWVGLAALFFAAALLLPTLVALPDRFAAVDESHQTDGRELDRPRPRT